MRCKHKRIKKNYPFGKNSKPTMHCKDCGDIIKPKDLENRRIKKTQKKK